MQTKQFLPVLLLFISSGCMAQKGLQSSALQERAPVVMTSPSFTMDLSVDKSNTHFNLLISNPSKKRLTVQISGTGMGALVDTVVVTSSFQQRYNMELVEDGQYIVTVKCGKEKQTKKIELKTVSSRNMELVK